MGIVGIRGAFFGESAESVAKEAIVALVVFAGVGAVAGWVAEYLVRHSVEQMFRSRIDWYRKELIEAGHLKSSSSQDS